MNEKTKSLIYIMLIVAGISSLSTYGITAVWSPVFSADAEKTDAMIVQILSGFTNQQQMIRTERVIQTSVNPETNLKQVEFESGFQLLRTNMINDTLNVIQTGDVLELGVIQAQPICQFVVMLDEEQVPIIDAVISNNYTFTLEKNPNCQPDTFAYELVAWKELEIP